MIPKNTVILLAFFLFSNNIKAQQTLWETMVHNNIDRTYTVYIPEKYDENIPAPLMFNFHGFTGSAEGHMNGTKMRPVADTAGFILVYPQGSLFFGETHWNVGAWTQGSSADDLGFTEAVIDELASKYNIDLDRVYSCGYSNGGYFSFELACQLSHRIAAIGSVGGKMSSETFNACNPLHPTPVITIHGTDDNIVTYEGPKPGDSKSISQVNTYWTNFNNTEEEAVVENIPNINISDGSIVESYAYNNGDNCTSVVHYKVIGGGHDWPGAWGNKDIDASSLIWDFVSQYDLNGLISCNNITNTVEVNRGNKILLYPNPTNDLITIDLELSTDTFCFIYSLMGERILTNQIGPNNKTINVSELPANIYFLHVGNQVMKLIKI